MNCMIMALVAALQLLPALLKNDLQSLLCSSRMLSKTKPYAV